MEALKNSSLLQKEIAKTYEVSQATVTNLKKKYLNKDSNKITGKIITINPEYPVSKFIDKSSNEREKANHNYKLIQIFKEVTAKNISEKTKKIFFEQISCLTYYEYFNTQIKIIFIPQRE